MSQEIQEKYRETEEQIRQIKCLYCKHFKWTPRKERDDVNHQARWECRINCWKEFYDKEHNECKEFERREEKINGYSYLDKQED